MLHGDDLSNNDCESKRFSVDMEDLLIIAEKATEKSKTCKRRSQSTPPNRDQDHKISRHNDGSQNRSTMTPDSFTSQLGSNEMSDASTSSSTSNQILNLEDDASQLVFSVAVNVWQLNKFDTYYQVIPNRSEVCPIHLNSISAKLNDDLEKAPLNDDDFKKRIGPIRPAECSWAYGKDIDNSEKDTPKLEPCDETKETTKPKSLKTPIKPPRKFKEAKKEDKIFNDSIKKEADKEKLSPQPVANKRHKSVFIDSARFNGKFRVALNLKRIIIAHLMDKQPCGLEKMNSKRKFNVKKCASLKKELFNASDNMKKKNSEENINDDKPEIPEYVNTGTALKIYLSSTISSTEMLRASELPHDAIQLTRVCTSSSVDDDDKEDDEFLCMRSMLIKCTLSRWPAINDLSLSDYEDMFEDELRQNNVPVTVL